MVLQCEVWLGFSDVTLSYVLRRHGIAQYNSVVVKHRIVMSSDVKVRLCWAVFCEGLAS